jgi:hypothetical protein
VQLSIFVNETGDTDAKSRDSVVAELVGKRAKKSDNALNYFVGALRGRSRFLNKDFATLGESQTEGFRTPDVQTDRHDVKGGFSQVHLTRFLGQRLPAQARVF